MIGLVIATHGKMSDGLVDAAELIIGSTDNIETLNLNQGDNVQDLNKQMLEAIQKVDQQDGVIVFTDLFGASPYNQATLAVHSLPKEQREKIFIITGINLPMLLEAINQRMVGTSLQNAVSAILDSAKESVVVNQLEEENTNEEDEF
ncbi:PTS sugar transporter subunit IIA [Fervidibacillus albus]|uniref:PTS sugar transporter subunit IIA n=1 Tax=Fervidibacillus albus TaxID=2980026 RepID=A0A9E8LT36_9BACI|nr:PTS sugar transporter subunit IIA [Fervidibacillus albus]WAA09115.1 PTS sugar transporter subunit IIA [Fervidibacillus albus]